MEDNKQPKKPTSTEILSEAPKRDTYDPNEQLQKIWRPGLKLDKPKK